MVNYWCAICFFKMLLKKSINLYELKTHFRGYTYRVRLIGLIYTGISIINHNAQITTTVVVGIIAILFFFTGISLIRTTKDEV
jgi:hypothetical protein